MRELLGETLSALGNGGVTAILSGFEETSAVWAAIAARTAEPRWLRRFTLLDDAIEWAEDQVIYRFGGFTDVKESAHLGEQALLAELDADEIAAIVELSSSRALHGRPAHHRDRRARQLAVLSPERDGQRQAAERRAARFARPRHGVRRDGDPGAESAAPTSLRTRPSPASSCRWTALRITAACIRKRR